MFGNKKECCVCGKPVSDKNMMKISFSSVFHGVEDTRTMYVCRDCHEQAAFHRVNELVMARNCDES